MSVSKNMSAMNELSRDSYLLTIRAFLKDLLEVVPDSRPVLHHAGFGASRGTRCRRWRRAWSRSSKRSDSKNSINTGIGNNDDRSNIATDTIKAGSQVILVIAGSPQAMRSSLMV